MACRRGFLDVVKFMITEANVSLYVKDDYGRTPMHDACWAPTPNFPLMKLLIEKAPEQLFLSDVRGHTPLSYTRKGDWFEWKMWIVEHEELLRKAVPN
jgi:ankyrin repeat protein